MPRTKQRTPELRDRMLAAAVELLARDGAAGLTARSVASEANTSAPALYELFGDRAGLLGEVFFEGFRRLGAVLATLEETDDPRADLLTLLSLYRGFTLENRTLSEVMFSRPFSDFDPPPDGLRTGPSVRRAIVTQVKRVIAAGVIAGDTDDIALVLVTTAQGLADAEGARRLGSSPESVDRRWALALNAVLDGLAPAPARG